MTGRSFVIGAALTVLAGAVPGWCDQFYLYSPRTVESPAVNHAASEILVREIQVQKGDTLYGLSRRFSGHGSHYPQILLFNDIKDPDKIYAGSLLRLPVTSTASPADVPVLPQPKPASAAPSAPKPAKVSTPAAAKGEAASQKLYEQAIKAYRRNDCPAALDLFDRFLALDPSSPLAADAGLYKAECYLKQSGQ